MLFQTCRCINSMFVEHMWQTIRTVVPTFQRNHLFVVDFMVLGKFLKFWPDRIINLKAFAIFALSIVMEVLPEFITFMFHPSLGIDVLFINLVIFCGSYFKYIQCKIINLHQDMENLQIDDETIRNELFEIVKKHNKGIKLAETLENVLNLVMLVLYSVNTIVLCFLMLEFQIVILIFFVVVQSLLILFSYFGSKLQDESEAVGMEIYDLPWYNLPRDPKIKRYLMLIMMRSQRAINITAGKFYPVTLKSYYEALCSAYSYCTVLLNIILK
uniref:Odorant receptor 4 n=1 Tax=Propsilocerus akamusi TaxID=903466 RepID=A0A7D0TEC1_9DIPT|nr:odorant receptor 4 [Propsilocerus akamusi]